MHRREVEGRNQLSLLKLGKDASERLDIYRKDRDVSEDMMLVSGTTGSGKSTFIMSLCYTLWKYYGFSVVFLSEKFGDSFASSFCEFPPVDDWQLSALEEQSQGVETIPVVNYHPFSFRIPFSGGLPDTFRFFSLPLKNLNEQCLASLFSGMEDAQSVRVCYNVLKKIGNSDGLANFLWKIKENLKKDESVGQMSLSSFLIDAGLEGDARTLSKVSASFEAFSEHFFLQDIACPYNLDFVKLINDVKHWHVFSTNWVTERRVRYFTILAVLNELVRALESGKIKKKLVIVLEEVKVLIPRSSETSYKDELAKGLVELLSTVRSKGKGVMVVATSQNYYDTNKQFRGSCNSRLFFRTSPEDRVSLRKNLNYNQSMIELLQELNQKVGYCVFADELERGIYSKYVADVPPFRHKTNSDYFSVFREVFPDRLVKYDDVLSFFSESKSLMQEYIRGKSQELKDVIEKEKAEKKSKQEKKEEIVKSEVKDVAKEERLKKKQELMSKCYELKKLSPKKSWELIGEELGVSTPTAKTYARKIAKERGDFEFLS